MAEKIRPGYMPPITTTTVPVGVTPNPANRGLSWPMSYASTTTQSSYERGSLSSPQNLPYQHQTTRYDPVRHDQYNQPDAQQDALRKHPIHVLANETGDTIQKRKRSETDPGTINTDDNNAYSYEPQKIVTPTNSLQSGKRNHVCDICGATFTRQHNLKSHFLTHTSSKKEFICSECGSEFRRSHDLKRHQKLHTGEKPFACNTCGRRFARADALGRHTKSSGEGGCVNSRKTSSDPGSTNHGGNAYAANSPGSHHGSHSDQFQTRSRNNSLHDHTSSTQISPIDPMYTGGPDQLYSTGPPSGGGRRPSPDSARAFHPTLPPLQTGFNFEKDRAFNQTAQAASNEGFMNTPRFGLSPAYDSSRPQSTHPLSFDRGTVTEGGGTPGSVSGPGVPPAQQPPYSMVPLQRYQQLEAEHREAMERIRKFESSKPDGADPQDIRPVDRAATQ